MNHFKNFLLPLFCIVFLGTSCGPSGPSIVGQPWFQWGMSHSSAVSKLESNDFEVESHPDGPQFMSLEAYGDKEKDNRIFRMSFYEDQLEYMTETIFYPGHTAEKIQQEWQKKVVEYRELITGTPDETLPELTTEESEYGGIVQYWSNEKDGIRVGIGGYQEDGWIEITLVKERTPESN